MEKVGDGYFDELLSRSFFQKSSSHKSCFVMHDPINDLAQHVYEKFCIHWKDGRMNEIPDKFRHLSYFRSACHHFEGFKILTNVSSLRTFLPLELGNLPFDGMDRVSKIMNPCRYYYSPSIPLSNKVLNDLLQKA